MLNKIVDVHQHAATGPFVILHMMHSALIKYIRERSESALTEKDITLLKEAFLPKKLCKKQFLLQAGEMCKYMGFIVEGATRQYKVHEKGTEYILNLCIENCLTSNRCYYSNQASFIYNIDAWVSSRIVGNSYSSSIDLLVTQPQGDNLSIAIWYDNEWGFSNRPAEIAAFLASN